MYKYIEYMDPMGITVDDGFRELRRIAIETDGFLWIKHLS